MAHSSFSLHRDVRTTVMVAALAGVAVARTTWAGEAAPPPLQLRTGEFPQLLAYEDERGASLASGCERVRGRRLDELDPRWRAVVERVHLDCDDVGTEPGSGVATAAVALLKPGRVQFQKLPVREVRMMDSQWWADHQYVLDVPFGIARPVLRKALLAGCHAETDAERISARGCVIQDEDEGLYLQVDAISGISVHPDPDDAQATIYAEVWAD